MVRLKDQELDELRRQASYGGSAARLAPNGIGYSLLLSHPLIL